MSDNPTPPAPGSILWHDLTVPDAERLRDFYAAVVGWKPDPVDMSGYSDFNMNQPDTGRTVAGVCHARGPNANLPPQWLIYIQVADLDASIKQCTDRGGTILDGPRSAGDQRFCVIQDPAGACAVLISKAG